MLTLGVLFCLMFGALTLAAIDQSGFGVGSVISILILGFILFGIVGAIRNPPG